MPSTRYHSVSITLHWVMALLISGVGLIGVVNEDIADRAFRTELMNLHFAFGSAILTLVVVRFAWRVINPPPQLASDGHPLMKRAAALGHFGLYAVMLGVPFLGLVATFLRGRGIDFGLFAVTSPVAADRALARTFGDLHGLAAYGFFAMIAGHTLLALWHHYVIKDGLLARMGIGKSSPSV